MSLSLAAGQSRWAGRGTRTGRGLLWTALTGAAAVLLGALYPASASVVGPWALPAAVAGAVLLALSVRRPGVGLAVAFVLTSLNPGLVGRGAWIPGVVWTALLMALLALRPAVSGDGRPPGLPPMTLPVLGYGATVLVAYAASPAPQLGLPLLRATVSGIALFVVAASTLRSWSDITSALFGTSLAAVVVGGLACLEHLGRLSTDVGFITSTGALVGRATGGLGHPNLLGGFLVVLVPLAAVAAVVDRRWRLLHLAGLLLAVGGIYASFSRGALLALLLMPFPLLRGRWLLSLVPAAVLALAIGVPSVMTERFTLGDQGGAEVAGRRDIWSTAGAIWLERPLLGTGLGGFPGTYAAVRVVGKQFLPDTRFEPPPHAHNLELQLLAEQGLVGFTAFGAVAATAWWSAAGLRRSRQRAYALLGGALLASLSGVFVHDLFDVTLVENAGVQVWGVLGILSAAAGLAQAEHQPVGP